MKAVLVAGGEPDTADARWLSDADLVVAVDGGAKWLSGQGCVPHALVGDLDSVDPDLLRSLEAEGVEIERHPLDKDSSDAELALAFAQRRGADEVVMIGAFGGERIDHEIANVLLLADTVHAGAALRLVRGAQSVRALRGGQRAALQAASGSTISLFPVGGAAHGVTTSGLRFALGDETLELGSTRGLSNVVAQPPAWVALREGILLVVEQSEGAESR